MYQLLIVEDELIEREGLRDLIDWNSMGINLAGAVESAEDALGIIENQSVDILLTDIKLLGMDGLELAKKAQKIRADLKLIFMSCWEDFEYARQAIDLHAVSFLSKPLDMDELTKAVGSVVDSFDQANRINEDRKRLLRTVEESIPLLKERFFYNLLHNLESSDSVEQKMRFYSVHDSITEYAVIILEIHNLDNFLNKMGIEELHLHEMRIREILEMSRPKEILHCLSEKNATFVFTCSSSAEGGTDSISRVIRDCIESNTDYAFTIGIGNPVKKLHEVYSSYKQALEAIQYRFFLGINQIIHYGDMNLMEKSGNYIEFQEYERRILTAIELCDLDHMNNSVDELFNNFLSQKGLTDGYVRNHCLSLISRCSVLLTDMHENLEQVLGMDIDSWNIILHLKTLNEMRVWFKDFLIGIIHFLKEKRKDHNKKAVKKVLEIIERSFNETLTLNKISREVFLSPNYIGIIFKKEMGESFSNYLIHFRLEKAKEMLKQTDLKVYQIGGSVGYSNISYFCTIFKEAYGMSPNEYREKV